MAEWQFDPESASGSPPEEKFKVFSLFLWGKMFDYYPKITLDKNCPHNKL